MGAPPIPPPPTQATLRGMTPRQLWDLAAERGIEVPPRATSAEVRSLLAGSGGTMTTKALPSRRDAFADLPYRELQRLAAERGHKVIGQTTDALLDLLAGG